MGCGRPFELRWSYSAASCKKSLGMRRSSNTTLGSSSNLKTGVSYSSCVRSASAIGRAATPLVTWFLISSSSVGNVKPPQVLLESYGKKLSYQIISSCSSSRRIQWCITSIRARRLHLHHASAIVLLGFTPHDMLIGWWCWIGILCDGHA